MVKREIEVWQKLDKHPNIVRYLKSSQVKGPDGRDEIMILNELCEGGTLIQIIEKNNQQLSEK